MADMFTAAKRSQIMARIRGTNTVPELATRRGLRALGLQTRTQSKLPGKPDILVPDLKTTVFVHGCFWHSHSCSRGTKPSTNTTYWIPKLKRNVTRFKEVRRELHRLGWRVWVIWECQTKRPAVLEKRLLALKAKNNEN
jgi:DNA mismatch endonuclease, patch repair protein